MLCKLFDPRPKQPRNNTRSIRYIPEAEHLGSRILPACSTSFARGLLAVTCNAANDKTVLKADRNGSILLNGSSISGGPTRGNTTSIKILGRGGNDRLDVSALSGFAGTIILDGGPGNDSLVGGRGKDSLIGGTGHDLLQGRDGNDVLEGGSGNDNLQGITGHDMIYGDAGHDSLFGGDGNDTLGGDDEDKLLFVGQTAPAPVVGNDLLNGGAGNDWLLGGSRSEQILDNNGRDTMTGGGGTDILDARGGDDTITDRQTSDIVPVLIDRTPQAGASHTHYVVQIFVNVDGRYKRVVIPAGVGVFNPMAGGHTHTSDGLIHNEGRTSYPFGLKELFWNWSVSFDAGHIGRYAGLPVTMKVNAVVNSRLGNYLPRDGDVIELRYG